MAELALCYENCDRTYALVQKLRANIFSVTKILAELIARYENCATIAAELIPGYENYD